MVHVNVVFVNLCTRLTKFASYAAHTSQTKAEIYQENPTCSENVANNTVTSTLRMPSHNKVTCSENIAYATTKTVKERST